MFQITGENLTTEETIQETEVSEIHCGINV